MKKLIGILIVICMLFSVGCSSKEELPESFREYEVTEMNSLEEFYFNLDYDMGFEEAIQFVLDSDLELDGNNINYSDGGGLLSGIVVEHPDVPDARVNLIFESGNEMIRHATYDVSKDETITTGPQGLNNFLNRNFKVSVPVEREYARNWYSVSTIRWKEGDEEWYSYSGSYTFNEERGNRELKSREETIQYLQYHLAKYEGE